MAPDIGRAALIVGFMVALAQSLIPLAGAYKRDARMMMLGDKAAQAQAAFVVLAFGCLVYSFVVSDFSVAIVAANSHTAKPMLYKVAATWGNHEGSMLLWTLVLAIFDESQLNRLLERVFDSREFLSEFGVRSLSKYHEQHPFLFGDTEVRYEPAETSSKLKGGNSNWRGPIWFPTTFLKIGRAHV